MLKTLRHLTDIAQLSLSLAMFLANGTATHAQPNKGDVAAGTVSRGTAPPGVISLPDNPDEIVVTAERRGEAKVAAETEFSEEEIAAQGADSIQDLLTRLAPFISDDGEEPVILINGKPAGFDRSILSYPAEALDRVAVLKPEAAAQYGEPAGRRVVNLVLKRNFATLDMDAGVNFATGGGQYGATLSARRTSISGDTRWNAAVRLGADRAFRKSARNLPPRDGVFDSVGFISATDGGEIDPALSLIAGEPVTVAAISPDAQTLGDFAASANLTHLVDPNRFETLQSTRRNASLGIGVTRPIGNFSASLNLNANRSSSEGERGLPMASVVLPSASPWSPFADDVLLTRPFAGERALRIDNGATSLSGSFTLNGNIGKWQASLGLNYSWSQSTNLLETGVDIARVQALIDAGDPDFNPFGLWDDGLLIASRNRTKSQNLGARFNIRKAIIELPAGPLTWNITANTSRNSTHSRQSDASDELIAVNRVSRSQSSGQTSLSIPIARRGLGGLGFLGDLTTDLTASVQTMTNSRAQKRYGSTISWSPWKVLQLRGSIDYTETSPSFEQLDAPIITTVNRIFDYARQETAEPVWITGGNPDLNRGNRQSLALAATLRPLGDQTLTINAGYRRSIANGGIAAFPELTPAIEAAFPERVTRDADGRLIAVDARAINIVRDSSSDLSSGIAYRLGATQRGGSAQAGADPLQFSISLNHRMRLTDTLLTGPGIAPIDQLRGGSQSRHNLSLQTSVGKRGIGASLNGNWSSPGRLQGGNDVFIFKPPMTFNLSAFAEPERLMASSASKKGVLKGLKISIDIQNLFNAYRRVTREDGTIPARYSRHEVDPLGRVVRLNLRKKF